MLLAACGGGAAVEAGAPAPAPTTAVAPAGVAAALRFSVDQVGGGVIDATTFAGKPVAFWFWAPG